MVAIQSIEISVHSGLQGGGVPYNPGPTATDAVVTSALGGWHAAVRLLRASDRELLAREVATGIVLLTLGDAGEVAAGSAPFVNATVMHIDLRAGTITVSNSLTGLPPVFLFRQNERVSLSSPFIPQAASGSLMPDMDGVADTLRWGHPIDGRTLFADLQVVLANATVTAHSNGSVTATPPAAWPDVTEFSAAYSR